MITMFCDLNIHNLSIAISLLKYPFENVKMNGCSNGVSTQGHLWVRVTFSRVMATVFSLYQWYRLNFINARDNIVYLDLYSLLNLTISLSFYIGLSERLRIPETGVKYMNPCINMILVTKATLLHLTPLSYCSVWLNNVTVIASVSLAAVALNQIHG